MLFETFSDAEAALLWGGFLIALVLGAVVNKTNFCTMGAVSDLVNIGDTGRMRAWLFAIAIAVLGVAVREHAGLVDATGTFPRYRGGNLLLAENILGGLLFGIGMTLASGCGNKTLIRIGGGNLTITAPDDTAASAALDGSNDAAVNQLMNQHFSAGPEGGIRHRKSRPPGPCRTPRRGRRQATRCCIAIAHPAGPRRGVRGRWPGPG